MPPKKISGPCPKYLHQNQYIKDSPYNYTVLYYGTTSQKSEGSATYPKTENRHNFATRPPQKLTFGAFDSE